MKERILRGWRSIPAKNLANYVKRGIVTLSELKNVGLPLDIEQYIIEELRADDDALWAECQRINTPEIYREYIGKYPNGMHVNEAHTALNALDDSFWNYIISDMSEESLNRYLELFPNGIHVSECKNLLNDLPWIKAKKENTIQGYIDFITKYPDSPHVPEARDAINELNDEKDWYNACLIGTTDAYRRYLEQHPSGKYANEARGRIQANAGRDKILEELRYDPNYYGAEKIQGFVRNNVVSWDDIIDIFGIEKTEEIQKFDNPVELPISTPPDSLTSGSTEVYFWGTPSSGKTCALASLISSIQSKGIFEPLQCPGYNYMIHLSNVFNNNGFCIFPPSTPIECIQEMKMNIYDKKNRMHKITLVDLSGELFESVYNMQHGVFLPEEKEKNVKLAMDYLKDQRNKKIHFFVVEYGALEKKFKGLTMKDYLNDMILFLKDNEIFRKSTVGVYILVTKCDIIDCSKEERPKKAFEYVTQGLPSFYNTLNTTCGKNGVGDLRVLSFSVGDVFAQNLCKYDNKDTDKVIEKLLTKTKAEGSKWDWLKD